MNPILWQGTKLFISAGLITGTSWLMGKNPKLAGFLLALPISTLIALAFGQLEFADSQKSVEFAQSVFAAVPLSLLFFVPFLFAQRLNWPFWGLYAAGIALLGFGYIAHTLLLGHHSTS
jgi:hypothetical protein